jgi:hypothetical protein
LGKVARDLLLWEKVARDLLFWEKGNLNARGMALAIPHATQLVTRYQYQIQIVDFLHDECNATNEKYYATERYNDNKSQKRKL